ncbi:serine/threonine-protein kinase atg1-like [Lactuca sativa]|uniref:serine/threonine-protein kinase atg1-like n=1 Tax=Lactuca sativa TaxID=4236 RepID=UPI000CD9EFFD|nr:serine/threonine-protein kinase atg1-like [Lactuca sativa]
MKEKLNSKLNDSITKFPEKETFSIFKENITNIIVEDKTESKFFLEFPSNEIGLEETKQRMKKQRMMEITIKKKVLKKKGETEVKENDGEINENENDEEKNNEETEETNNDGDTNRKNETNQNLLEKVVENIVDNVLGIGFSSLNSKEDEIWINPEMKTILDNIDIWSLITRSKTYTSITQVIQGKENSEGIHKQRGEVEKGKRDDIGKWMERESLNMEIKEEWKLRRQKEMMEVKINKEKLKLLKKNKDKGGDKQAGEVEKGNADDRDGIFLYVVYLLGKGKCEDENKKGGEVDKTKGNK